MVFACPTSFLLSESYDIRINPRFFFFVKVGILPALLCRHCSPFPRLAEALLFLDKMLLKSSSGDNGSATSSVENPKESSEIGSAKGSAQIPVSVSAATKGPLEKEPITRSWSSSGSVAIDAEWNVWDDRLPLPQADAVSFCTVISACSRECDADTALKLLARMCQEGIGRHQGLSSSEWARREPKGSNSSSINKSVGGETTSTTDAITASAAVKTRSGDTATTNVSSESADADAKVLTSASDHSSSCIPLPLVPNPYCVTAAITACSRAKKPDKAVELFLETLEAEEAWHRVNSYNQRLARNANNSSTPSPSATQRAVSTTLDTQEGVVSTAEGMQREATVAGKRLLGNGDGVAGSGSVFGAQGRERETGQKEEAVASAEGVGGVGSGKSTRGRGARVGGGITGGGLTILQQKDISAVLGPAFNATVNTLARARRHAEARELVENMKEKGFKAGREVFNSLLLSCSDSKGVSEDGSSRNLFFSCGGLWKW